MSEAKGAGLERQSQLVKLDIGKGGVRKVPCDLIERRTVEILGIYERRGATVRRCDFCCQLEL